jgi:hypothetical protein
MGEGILGGHTDRGVLAPGANDLTELTLDREGADVPELEAERSSQ